MDELGSTEIEDPGRHDDREASVIDYRAEAIPGVIKLGLSRSSEDTRSSSRLGSQPPRKNAQDCVGDRLLCPRGTKVLVETNHEREHGPCIGAHKIVMGNRLLCPRGTKVSVN